MYTVKNENRLVLSPLFLPLRSSKLTILALISADLLNRMIYILYSRHLEIQLNDILKYELMWLSCLTTKFCKWRTMKTQFDFANFEGQEK